MRDRIVLTKRPSSNLPLINNDSPAEYAPLQISNGLYLSIGDYILLFPANQQADLYIARIESIRKDSIGKQMLHVRWFYRAKDLRHQPPSCPKSDEVYLTNYFDYQPGDSVVAKCKIVTKTHFRTLKMARWNEMVDAREKLYVCEYTYSAETGAFTPIQDDLAELSCGDVNNREQRAPLVGTDALAKEFGEILINIEMTISEGVKPYFWKSSRPAWMVKTKEARSLKDIIQAFLDLEEGLQVFDANKSSPCSDYITWKKTISEVNTYELLAKYVKHFKQILSKKSTKLLDHASQYSSSMHYTFDSPMQKKRKRCPAELTMVKRPMKLSEGESIVPLPQSAALMMLPATALDSRNADDTGFIRSGVVYEMDHRSLPPKVPIQMKSLRVVMVSEIASLHVTVKFPSSLSLKMYFQTRGESTLNEVISKSCIEFQQETSMGTKPDMDEHFVMSPKTAERVLVRPVSCTEYLHQGHLKTFWFTEDHMRNQEKVGEKNELYGITRSMSIQAVSEAPCHQTVTQTTEIGIPQQGEQLFKEEESTKSLTTTIDTMNADDNTRYLLDSVGRVDVSNSQSEIFGSSYRHINQSQKDPQPLKLTNFFKDDNEENNNTLQPQIQIIRKNSVWAQDVSLLQNLECADNGDVNYDELAAGIKAAAETLAHLIPETMNNRDERGIGTTVKAVQDNEGPIHWGIRRKVSSFGRCRGQSAGSCDTGPVPKDFDRNNIGKENLQGRSRSKLINFAKTPGIQKNSVQNPASNSSSLNNAREKLNFSSQPNILKLPKDMQGRWSSERYKSAQLKLLDIMHQRGAAPGNPILRPALREEARKHIGDTGLLDHLLKHMTDTVVCNGERFRRRHNAEGAMEYWLEDASLMEIRRMAGIEDPSWIPPPGWKPGDKLPERGGCIYSKGMSPSEAAEMKQLQEDVESLKSEMLSIARQLKSAQTDVHLSSRGMPDEKNLGHQNCSEKSVEDDMKSQFQIIKLKMLEMQSALSHVQEQQQNQDKILRTLQMRKPETSCERNNFQRRGDETASVQMKRLDYTIKRLENLELEVKKLSQENMTRYEIYVAEKKALESQISATWKTIAKMKEEFQTAHETIGVRKLQTQQPVECPLKISCLPILYAQAKGDPYSGMTHALDQKSSLMGTAATYDVHPQIEYLKSAPHSLHTKEMTLLKNQLHNVQNSNLYYSAQGSASQTLCGTAPHESPKLSMRMPINFQERCHRKPPTMHQLPSAFPWPAAGSTLHGADDGLSPSSAISASASSSPTFYNLKGAESSTTMTVPPQMLQMLPSYDHDKLGTSSLEKTKSGHAKLTHYEQNFMRSPLSATGASSSSSFLPANPKPTTFLFSGNASIDSNRCVLRETSLSLPKQTEDSPAGQTPRLGSQGQTLTTIASVVNDHCGPAQSEEMHKVQSTNTSPKEQYDNTKKDPITHLSLASETSCSSYVVVQATSTMQSVSRGTDELNASFKVQCLVAPSSSLPTHTLATSMPNVAQTHAGIVLENFQQALVSSLDMRKDTSTPTHKLSESSISIPTDGLDCFLIRKSGEIANTVSMTSW